MPTTELPITAGLQGSKTARISAWALAGAIVILSLVPPHLRPKTAAQHGLEHFTIFAATGFAFGLGYKRRHDLVAILLVMFSGAARNYSCRDGMRASATLSLTPLQHVLDWLWLRSLH
jgi:hypothetical protein